MQWKSDLMLDEFYKRESNESFDWIGAFEDGGIIAAIAFLTHIIYASSLFHSDDLFAAAVQAALAFFTSLALKRGILKQEKSKNKKKHRRRFIKSREHSEH
jgi:hypothetical protein